MYHYSVHIYTSMHVLTDIRYLTNGSTMNKFLKQNQEDNLNLRNIKAYLCPLPVPIQARWGPQLEWFEITAASESHDMMQVVPPDSEKIAIGNIMLHQIFSYMEATAKP